jgi:hypothetical protein
VMESYCSKIWNGVGRLAVQTLQGNSWVWALEEHLFGLGCFYGEDRILCW